MSYLAFLSGHNLNCRGLPPDPPPPYMVPRKEGEVLYSYSERQFLTLLAETLLEFTAVALKNDSAPQRVPAVQEESFFRHLVARL